MDWEKAVIHYCKVNEAPKSTTLYSQFVLEERMHNFLTNLKAAIDSGTERIGAGREEELTELLRDLDS